MYSILKLIKYNSYSKINNNIYIGNKDSSMDKNFIKSKNINVIINCSKNLPFTELKNIIKIRIPINDDQKYSSITLMSKYLQLLIPKLNKLINNKNIILVHCRCGMQRSATIIAALLIYRYKLKVWQAIQVVRVKRLIAFLPFPNFLISLQEYNKILSLN